MNKHLQTFLILIVVCQFNLNVHSKGSETKSSQSYQVELSQFLSYPNGSLRSVPGSFDLPESTGKRLEKVLPRPLPLKNVVRLKSAQLSKQKYPQNLWKTVTLRDGRKLVAVVEGRNRNTVVLRLKAGQRVSLNTNRIKSIRY